MRTSIATVCLSGTLTEKLHAAAEAGFDGVELFEPDLVASPASPEEIVALAARLGLSLDLYQPFRDAEGVTEEEFAAGPAPGPRQVPADAAARHRHDARVQQRRHRDRSTTTRSRPTSCAASATRPPRTASASPTRPWPGGSTSTTTAAPGGSSSSPTTTPSGVCLDSFHILSRGHDPAAIEEIPGDEDLLPPARGRAGPDDGRAVLVAAPPPVPGRGRLRPRRLHRPRPARRLHRTRCRSRSSTTSSGRPTCVRTAARRAVTDLARGPGGRLRRRYRAADRPHDSPRSASRPASTSSRCEPRTPARSTCSSVSSASPSAAGTAARTPGCGPRARPGWSATSSTPADRSPTLAAVGFEVEDPAASAARAARAPGADRLPPTLANEQELPAFRAPDGTEVFLGSGRVSAGRPWVPEFEGGHEPASPRC